MMRMCLSVLSLTFHLITERLISLVSSTMFLNYFVLLLIFVANFCLSHDVSQEDTVGSNSGVEGGSSGVKGGRSRQGVKTYGGYNHDHGNNQNGHTAQYHQPQFFQPYGWNFNQPQRTYGKVTKSTNDSQESN